MVVYYGPTTRAGRVYVRDLVTDPERQPQTHQLQVWTDTDGDGVRDGDPPPSGTAILSAISGSGRIVAFLSRDPALNDPQGDGNGPAAPTPPSADRWLIYIHDRDADGNDTLDEAKVGGTTTRFVPDPTGNTPLFVTLTEVRLSLDQTGRSLAFSTWMGHAMATLVRPRCPKPIPTTDSDIIFSFLHPFCGRFPPRLHRFRSVLNSQALINGHHRASMSWTLTPTKPSLSRLTA
jgi:hypothetical protein